VLRLGFKNIWRNKKRSVLTMFLVGMGCASLSFLDGFIRGMEKAMIDIATNTLLGQVVLSNADYDISHDENHTVDIDQKWNDVLSKISKIEDLSYSLKIYAPSMVASSQDSSSVILCGF
jgi:hypothetical protein